MIVLGVIEFFPVLEEKTWAQAQPPWRPSSLQEAGQCRLW